MKEETKKNNIFLVIIFFIIVFLILIFLYARNLATKGLIIHEYKVESAGLPSYFSGIKIVHFSDIYYNNTTSIEDLKNLEAKINILKPDLIIFTGDLFKESEKIKEKESNKVVEVLSNFKAKLGKYAIKGNLDYDIDSYESIMEKSGFIVLENEYNLIYNNGLEPIFLCGLGSKIQNNQELDKCNEYFEINKEDLNIAKYKIYLIHEGDSVVDVLKTDENTNLILGGHSLGGLVNIPFYGELFIPKYSQKYSSLFYKEKDTNIFISSGIGTDEKKVRLFNKPSFNFYRLKSLQ